MLLNNINNLINETINALPLLKHAALEFADTVKSVNSSIIGKPGVKRSIGQALKDVGVQYLKHGAKSVSDISTGIDRITSAKIANKAADLDPESVNNIAKGVGRLGALYAPKYVFDKTIEKVNEPQKVKNVIEEY